MFRHPIVSIVPSLFSIILQFDNAILTCFLNESLFMLYVSKLIHLG